MNENENEKCQNSDLTSNRFKIQRCYVRTPYAECQTTLPRAPIVDNWILTT